VPKLKFPFPSGKGVSIGTEGVKATKIGVPSGDPQPSKPPESTGLSTEEAAAKGLGDPGSTGPGVPPETAKEVWDKAGKTPEETPGKELTPPGGEIDVNPKGKGVLADDLKLTTDLPVPETPIAPPDDKGGGGGGGGGAAGPAAGSGGCFAAGTPVTMADGSARNIEEVRLGDEVMAFDEATRSVVPRRVVKTHEHAPEAVLGLRVRGVDTEVRVTPVHRFFMSDRWRAIRRAAPGTAVSVWPGGDALEPREILSLEPLEAPVAVYNLTVDTSSTYFVAGMLVHNAKNDEEEEPGDDEDD